MLSLFNTRLTFTIFVWVHLILACVSGNDVQRNVALGKVASQSTTTTIYVHPCTADVAVDGNTGPSWHDGSCTHTDSEVHPYWQVDLGDTYRIDHILIYNRVDAGVAYWTKDIQTAVSVDGTNFKSVCYHPGQIPDVLTCAPDIWSEGRWIRISIESNDSISLCICEVEVMVRKEHFRSIPSVHGHGILLQTTIVQSSAQCIFNCIQNTGCLNVNVFTTADGIECRMFSTDSTVSTSDPNVVFWKWYG